MVGVALNQLQLDEKLLNDAALRSEVWWSRTKRPSNSRSCCESVSALAWYVSRVKDE